MAVSPIFVLGVHLSLGMRQVHSCFRYDFGVRQGSAWCFVTRVESVVTRVREKGRLYSSCVAEMLIFSTFVTRVWLQ